MSNASPFVQPPSAVRIPGGIVTLGGPELRIDIGGRVVLFEMHSYFGPTPLVKATGSEMLRVPKRFYDAIELWEAGGKLVDGNLCVIPPRLQKKLQRKDGAK